MEETKVANFSAFYKATLYPELQKLEKERELFLSNLKRYCLPIVALSVIILLTGFWGLWKGGSDLSMVIAIALFIIALIVAAVRYYNFDKTYTPDFKDRIVKRIIHHIDDQLDYQPKSCVPRINYLKSNIFPKRPDRYKGEDLICGKVGDTYISFSELHSEYKTTSTDSKGRTKTTWHTIFKGIFFEADFNKEFKTRTYVLPDNLEKTFGFLGKKLQAMNFSRPPLVKLEDPEFEKHFVVYGEDQVESRYILSTSLMQRLTHFRNKTNKSVALSFVDNSIFVAIPESKNLFEPKVFRSNLDPAFIQEYYNFLQLTIGIVDDLNLNLRIWTKLP